MGPLSPEQLVDRDCDTVPDVEDACPDVRGVPQPLASQAGCPLELNEDGSYGR